MGHNTNLQKARFIVSVAMPVVITICALATPALAKEPPEARTQQLMGMLKNVKTPPDGGALSDDDKKANQETFKSLDAFFDYDKLTGDAIAPHKKSLSADQLARFSRDFRDLVRLVSFPRSGAFVNQAKVTVGKPKGDGKKAMVDMHASVPEQDVETNITFQWEDEGTAWRITDVSFDGVSVVKDYQNQFGKMIKKEGVDGFLKKLNSRLVEERKNNAS